MYSIISNLLTVLMLYLINRNIVIQGYNNAPRNHRELLISSTLSEDYQLNQCKLIPIVHLLHYPGCLPQTISSFACRGYCNSYVQPSGSKFWQLERSCTCCQQIGEREASIRLECPGHDPSTRTIITKAPVECFCRACLDISKEDIKPQELVDVLSKENE